MEYNPKLTVTECRVPSIACESITGAFDSSVTGLPKDISQISAPTFIKQNNELADAINQLNHSLTTQHLTSPQSAELITILEKINNTLSSTPSGSFQEVILGALFSVIAAFTFNLIYWYVVDKKKKLSTAIAKFASVLDSFEKTSTEYWTFGYQKRSSKKNTIQEMRMKAEHSILRKNLATVIKHIRNNQLKNNTDIELKSLLSNLFDTATGGDFESVQRQEDLKRVGKIIKICTQARVTLAGLDS